MPVLVIDPTWPAQARLMFAWSVEHFLIATTMLVVGVFSVLSWDSMFPGHRDVLVLGPLPIRAHTILLAKLAAVVTALSLAVVTLHAASGVVWPLALNAGRPRARCGRTGSDDGSRDSAGRRGRSAARAGQGPGGRSAQRAARAGSRRWRRHRCVPARCPASLCVWCSGARFSLPHRVGHKAIHRPGARRMVQEQVVRFDQPVRELIPAGASAGARRQRDHAARSGDPPFRAAPNAGDVSPRRPCQSLRRL